MNVIESWLNHQPTYVITTMNIIVVMWDSEVMTTRKVRCNTPDILVHDKVVITCQIIDVIVSMCKTIVQVYAEKLTNHHDLEIEIQKCWNLVKVKTIPVMVGAPGDVSTELPSCLHTISLEIKILSRVENSFVRDSQHHQTCSTYRNMT